MNGITDLPPELFDHIFDYLSDDDVIAARRSYKSLERATFTRFGQIFRKKGFMLITESLHVLESISNHPELRKFVQHVWFNPDYYTFQDKLSFDNPVTREEYHPKSSSDTINGPHEEGFNSSEQFVKYMNHFVDHNKLLLTNELQETLVRSFRNLPNLETIGMRRSEDHSPWGWSKLKKEVGRDPRVLGPIPNGPASGLSAATKLFSAIINAVAESNVTMKRLYTDAVEIDNVRPEDIPPDNLRKACCSLLYLEINAVKAWLERSDPNEAQRYNPLTNPDDFGSGLVRLFTATTHLRELGLQIFPDRKQSHLLAPEPRLPDTWRQSYPYLTLSNLTSHVSLEFLTRVKLEKVTSSPDTLQNFFRPCASHLCSLKLRDIRLLSSERKQKPWKSIFTFLAKDCTSLEYILLHRLLHDRGCVAFVENPPVLHNAGTMFQTYAFPARARRRSPPPFTDYDDITICEIGREEVGKRLTKAIDHHWYCPSLSSHQMDNDLWHTDTSDEE